jgi:hypothetical protein
MYTAFHLDIYEICISVITGATTPFDVVIVLYVLSTIKTEAVVTTNFWYTLPSDQFSCIISPFYGLLTICMETQSEIEGYISISVPPEKVNCLLKPPSIVGMVAIYAFACALVEIYWVP